MAHQHFASARISEVKRAPRRTPAACAGYAAVPKYKRHLRQTRHWHLDCLFHGAFRSALLWDNLDRIEVLLRDLGHGEVVESLEDAPDALLGSGLDHLLDFRRDLRQ